MDFTTYDFVVLCIIAPILLFRFTLIPAWILKKTKTINPVVRNVIIGIILLMLSGIIVATCSQGVALRFVAFTIALMGCIIHHTYTSEKEKEDKSDEES